MTEDELKKVESEHAPWIDPDSHERFCHWCSEEGRRYAWVEYPCPTVLLAQEVRRLQRRIELLEDEKHQLESDLWCATRPWNRGYSGPQLEDPDVNTAGGIWVG